MTETRNLAGIGDLARHFENRLEVTRACQDLISSSSDSSSGFFSGDPSATSATLNEARLNLATLKEEIKVTRKHVQDLKSLVQKTAMIKKFLVESRSEFENVASGISSHPRMSANVNAQKAQRKDSKETAPTVTKSNKNTNQLKKQEIGGGAQSKTFPDKAKVQYLTIAEFDSIPKYMKGRLSYDQINQSVDELNQAMEKKYHFYLKGFQAMASIKDKNTYKTMRALETRDTKGLFFVVADDLKSSSTLKSESCRRTIFTILRHCHRVKEIRGPGMILRYATGF